MSTDNYTEARLNCESLDVFCGLYEDGDRTDIGIGVLLAGAAQARAILALVDVFRERGADRV